jgi:acyl carrier protein
MDQTIRTLLAQHGGLQTPADTLRDDDDLPSAGMTSFATVQLMLALEEAFDVEFPEERLNARTFATVASIRQALTEAGAKLAA